MNLWGYLLDGDNWFAPGGIAQRIAEHLLYCGSALAVAMIIGLPIGAAVGHYRKGDFFVVASSNAARAIPTLGLLVLVVTLMGSGLIPVTLALTVLAVPPVLTAAAVGFRTPDADAVHAATGLGMTGWQVMSGIELPLALPLLVSGIRSAALQLIATATVAAMAAAGGLGRLIVDGQLRGQSGYPEMFAGAVIVAVLAVVVDVVLTAVGWGLTRLTRRRVGHQVLSNGVET